MKGMEKFVESKEMLDFLTDWLKNEPLRWCKVITASRASIEDKAAALLALSTETTPNKMRNPKKMAEQVLAAIEETRNAPSGSVFMLCENWQDNNDWNEDCGRYQTPFATFEQAQKYIKEQEADSSVDYPNSCWFDITRWDLDENGVLVEALTWYLSVDAVIWGFEFEKEKLKVRGDDDFAPMYYPDLNVRVPYQAGEIVFVDMSPFIAPFPAVIAEAEREEYTDCCQPQILYVNKYGNIDGGALKHVGGFPSFSPLLRLKRYTSALNDKHAPMQFISEVITKNPEKGRLMLDKIHAGQDKITRGVSWDVMKAWVFFSNSEG